MQKEEVKMVSFDRKKLQDLIRAYNKAKTEGKDQFVFEGSDVLTSYAYYLIKYLAKELGETRQVSQEVFIG